jgi:purine-binding chemotaxis protein CheW
MALGGNLKKQKLIPDTKTKPVAKKATPSKKAKKPVLKKSAEAAVKKSLAVKKEDVKSTGPKKVVKKPQQKVAAIQEQDVEVTKVVSQPPRTEERYVSKEALAARQQMRKRYEAEIAALGDKTIQLIEFEIGDESFALDISHVKEVVATPPAAKVPGMPPYYKGIVNIRGNTVMALDFNEKLGLPRLSASPYIMVLKTSQLSLGILLSELPNALKVKGGQISSSLKTLSRSSHEVFIKGVIKLEGKLVFYIDVEELVNSDKAVEFPEELVKEKK